MFKSTIANSRTPASMLIAAACIASAGMGMAHATGVSTADLEIKSIRHTLAESSYFCEVTVRNVNDDTARGVQVVVLLPNHVRFTNATPGTSCTAGAPAGNWHGFVTCSLGDINPANTQPNNPTAQRSVMIKTTAPVQLGANFSRSCAAFVYSSTSDHRRGTNFKVSE